MIRHGRRRHRSGLDAKVAVPLHEVGAIDVAVMIEVRGVRWQKVTQNDLVVVKHTTQAVMH